MKTLTQTKLSRTVNGLEYTQIAFLDERLKIGDEVTLKNEDGAWWKVVAVYKTARQKDLDKQRKWNNNI